MSLQHPERGGQQGFEYFLGGGRAAGGLPSVHAQALVHESAKDTFAME